MMFGGACSKGARNTCNISVVGSIPIFSTGFSIFLKNRIDGERSVVVCIERCERYGASSILVARPCKNAVRITSKTFCKKVPKFS